MSKSSDYVHFAIKIIEKHVNHRVVELMEYLYRVSQLTLAKLLKMERGICEDAANGVLSAVACLTRRIVFSLLNYQ